MINFVLCLLVLYFGEPALTGPFGGWQWVFTPLVISSVANLFAFARPALGVLEEASAVSQGRIRSTQNTPARIPANASRGAIAAGIFGLVVVGVLGFVVSDVSNQLFAEIVKGSLAPSLVPWFFDGQDSRGPSGSRPFRWR